MSDLPEFMDESIPIEQQFKAIQNTLTTLALRMSRLHLSSETAELITHLRNQAVQIEQQHSTIAGLRHQLRLANEETERLRKALGAAE